MDSLLDCYNQTILPELNATCFDEPRCYNQTELESCFHDKSSELKFVEPCCYGKMKEKSSVFEIIYIFLLFYFMSECVFRFVAHPRFDPLYDLAIIGADFACSFPAIFYGYEYWYFGIALPVRIGFLVADLELMKPIMYKISLAVPPMLYIGMLFTTMMYFFGAVSYVIFGPKRNVGCVSCSKYFDSLQRSMLTMFQVSMFQNWGDVTDDMVREPDIPDLFVISYFYIYGIITTFVLFNVFYALVTEIIMDWHGVDVPADASTSFVNRVLLEFLFQFFEIFLTEEDRKKFEDCEASNNFTSLKFWVFVNSLKSYFRNFLGSCFWFSTTEDFDVETTSINPYEIKNYGTATGVEDDETEHEGTLLELLLLVKSIDERVKRIEERVLLEKTNQTIVL
ncbi:NaCP60E [Acrasis kona]|uniref:NaCP60E n=1 Tax=Acrasis kona TaxID=1008807 RepID=A0AAW2Z664_9EUKA